MNKNSVMAVGQRWQLAFFISVHIIIFSALFHTVYSIGYSSTGLYFNFANQVMMGGLPYRDFPLEYPPFSLFFFMLPRLFTSTYVPYAALFEVEVIVFVLIGLIVIYDIARRLGQAPWKMLTVFTLGILAMGPITGQQYDIFPAIMVLVAIYCFWRGMHEIAWGLLALCTLTKIFPAVIAPIFLIYYIRNRRYRYMLSGPITFLAVGLAVLLPFLILDPDSILSVIDYHAQRGIQIESTYSSFLILADQLGLASVRATFGFGSWNLEGSIEVQLATLSTFILIFFLLLAYVYIYSRTRPGKIDVMQTGAYSLLAVLIVLIASKVLSPQYIIWIIPLLPFAGGRWRLAVWVIFFVVGGLTYLIFPLLYSGLINFDSPAVAALLVRNILLIMMAVFITVSLRPKQEGGSKEQEV